MSQAYRLAYTLAYVICNVALAAWGGYWTLTFISSLAGRPAAALIAVLVTGYLFSVPVRMLRKART